MQIVEQLTTPALRLVRSKTQDIGNRRYNEFGGLDLSYEPHFGWKGHVELNSMQLLKEEIKQCVG